MGGDNFGKTESARSQFFKAIGGIVALVFLAVILYPLFNQAKLNGHGRPCISRIKQMSLGLIIYSGDYDDTLPKAKGWMDSIVKYTKDETIFHDLQGVNAGEYGYSFREKASGLKAVEVPKPEIFEIVFDSSLVQRNAHSELWSLPKPGRHNGYTLFGYLDGHAKGILRP